ncbi:MAG: 2Fe-2S iron-sulfur cluster-binding protein, partial [Myxococcota bacterium]
LRDVLFSAGLPPHNGQTRWFNCKGMGSCGTCAVEIQGPTPPQTVMEQWRLRFPPHEGSGRLRLACQVTVQGDLDVQKHPGFWGQDIPDLTEDRGLVRRPS